MLPGEVVNVTGIVKTKIIKGINELFLHINYIESNEKILDESYKITDEDIIKIEEIAKNNPLDILIEKIFPDIYWNSNIKKGLVLQIFSGDQFFSTNDLNKYDNNIHVLIESGPGQAKSEVEKEVLNVVPKSKYVNGAQTTLPGLNGSVVKDELTNQWKVMGGAIPLSNNGICCIDEIDKTPDSQLLLGLNEPMAQKTVTISKAGLNVTMMANTRILATGNPNGSIFVKSNNMRINIYAQLGVDATTLSRFDLIFAMIDDKSDDELVDSYLKVLNSKNGQNPEDIELIKKYILYSNKINPTISDRGNKIIAEYIIRLKKHAKAIGHSKPITIRQLLSLNKLSKIIARIKLSSTVSDEDIKEAIRIYTYSVNTIGFDMNANKFFKDIKISDDGEK